jgi:hypothetical protein
VGWLRTILPTVNIGKLIWVPRIPLNFINHCFI